MSPVWKDFLIKRVDIMHVVGDMVCFQGLRDVETDFTCMLQRSNKVSRRFENGVVGHEVCCF